jgi:hypothetical protein
MQYIFMVQRYVFVINIEGIPSLRCVDNCYSFQHACPIYLLTKWKKRLCIKADNGSSLERART